MSDNTTDNQTYRKEASKPEKALYCANIECPYELAGCCRNPSAWLTCRRHKEP